MRCYFFPELLDMNSFVTFQFTLLGNPENTLLYNDIALKLKIVLHVWYIFVSVYIKLITKIIGSD
jgi:hypothetical protein